MTEALSRESLVSTEDAAQSPGLRLHSALGAAYELKFQLTPFQADDVLTWAKRHLRPDPHGDQGSYRTTSVYCDTPQLDVYHRTKGYRRSKFRLRRYGDMQRVYLEKKSKRGDEVQKRRCEITPEELAWLAHPTTDEAWTGNWFHSRIQKRLLRPMCRVGYRRTAFFGLAGDSPVRLTIDQDLVGVPALHWEVPPLSEGIPLLPDGFLVELKFHGQLPPLFRELMSQLPGQTARVSKYRRCVLLCGLQSCNGNLAGESQESA